MSKKQKAKVANELKQKNSENAAEFALTGNYVTIPPPSSGSSSSCPPSIHTTPVHTQAHPIYHHQAHQTPNNQLHHVHSQPHLNPQQFHSTQIHGQSFLNGPSQQQPIHHVLDYDANTTSATPSSSNPQMVSINDYQTINGPQQIQHMSTQRLSGQYQPQSQAQIHYQSQPNMPTQHTTHYPTQQHQNLIPSDPLLINQFNYELASIAKQIFDAHSRTFSSHFDFADINLIAANTSTTSSSNNEIQRLVAMVHVQLELKFFFVQVSLRIFKGSFFSSFLIYLNTLDSHSDEWIGKFLAVIKQKKKIGSIKFLAKLIASNKKDSRIKKTLRYRIFSLRS